MHSLLVVDDRLEVLEDLGGILRRHNERWELHHAPSTRAATELLRQVDLSLVIAEVHALDRGGFELLRKVRSIPGRHFLPVLVLTSAEDGELRERALAEGATDILRRPIDPVELMARVGACLRQKWLADQLEARTSSLETAVRASSSQLEAERLDLVWRLARAGEFRDEQTGHHVVRVGYHAKIIAEELGLSRNFARSLLFTAPLHDLGKIGIPDAILLKPAALTRGEWNTMREHTVIGASILGSESMVTDAFSAAGVDLPEVSSVHLENPLLEMAARIALSHHERWDGLGYPNGISGKLIPVEARITAIADVFDALRSDRPYKGAMPVGETLIHVAAGAGSQFDPEVYEAFTSSLSRALDTLALFADPPMEIAEAELTSPV